MFFERKPGSQDPWTKDLWIYDLRTNQHFTLKQNPLTHEALDDFVESYRPGAMGRRTETDRFKKFSYDEIVARDKASLDIFWLRDESLEDTDNLPAPEVIATEIAEDLRSARRVRSPRRIPGRSRDRDRGASVSDRLGVSITLFLADGTPDGLRIVEKTGWSGIGLMFARSNLAEVKVRPELSATGIYVLFGETEDSGFSKRIYVGEGDEVLKRLVSHQDKNSRDFWTSTIVFTSKDGNLNKAHARYLESRLVSLATEAKRSEIDNATMPQSPPLSERDRAEAEGFLREMLVIFPVLGLDSFERAQDTESVRSATDVRYRFFERGAKGEGADRPEGFVVFAGSVVTPDETQSCPDSIRRLRRTLQQEGVLTSIGGVIVLQQDYIFSSPSSAGGVLSGGSVNGRTAWVSLEGVPLKQNQQQMAGHETGSESND